MANIYVSEVVKRFKVGDVVSYTNGDTFSNGNKSVTIERLDGNNYWFLETASCLTENQCNDRLRLVTKPHKHCEMIKAWADGAVIQLNTENGWFDCPKPAWDAQGNYRIKPEKTEAELEKESIIKEMDALKVRLDKLELDYV
jgi:hypothetical protein